MGMQGDFFQLLKAQGYQFGASGGGSHDQQFTTATTILAFKYRDGVLVAGDRRATAGNMVMYDRTDKVLEIDRHSVMTWLQKCVPQVASIDARRLRKAA